MSMMAKRCGSSPDVDDGQMLRLVADADVDDDNASMSLKDIDEDSSSLSSLSSAKSVERLSAGGQEPLSPPRPRRGQEPLSPPRPRREQEPLSTLSTLSSPSESESLPSRRLMQPKKDGKILTCQWRKCHEKFKKMCKYIHHEYFKHQKKKLKCASCGRKFTSKSGQEPLSPPQRGQEPQTPPRPRRGQFDDNDELSKHQNRGQELKWGPSQPHKKIIG
ncbi:hypothetical protein DERF_001786 [Dermatophagoides farinae]|uniref:C2H2-type domain-containing protein n=1 Tax=Dermatophagoides farinae TaxID=6954 RepID=A0A922IEE3_DERFA|nr:hypothetical protein DERF_001786 [Dermatophagoides farinae]